MDLYVENPHQIWFAHPGDFRPCPFDDGGRYDDTEPLDWGWVCTAITHVVNHWDQACPDPDDGTLHFVLPDPPSQDAGHAVLSWGQGAGCCPLADPGEEISDGVHRTEGCWQHRPDMILPIRSDILSRHDEGADVRSRLQGMLGRIVRGDVTLDRRLPGNRAWVRQMRQAAGLELG